MREWDKKDLEPGVPAVVTTTDAGLIGVNGRVGDAYVIYPSTYREVSAFNVEKKIHHKTRIIWAEGKGSEGWLPADCLTWLGKEKMVKTLGILQ